MNCFVPWGHKDTRPGVRLALRLLAVLACYSLTALAQTTNKPESANTPFTIQATHILGFESSKNNSNGSLSIQDDSLRFQLSKKPAAQVKISSIQDVLLGGESKQVGGLPMTMGKAAAPYGGGRVVSLFAHKKYDIVTLEYVDSVGGIHWAIFQLNQGQGELVKKELIARGVGANSSEGQSKQSTAEVTNENK